MPASPWLQTCACRQVSILTQQAPKAAVKGRYDALYSTGSVSSSFTGPLSSNTHSMSTIQCTRSSFPKGTEVSKPLVTMSHRHYTVGSRPQNLIEKLVQRYADPTDGNIHVGDYVYVRPWRVMTHDNTAPVVKKFAKLASNLSVHNPAQLVFTLDHDVQNRSVANSSKYRDIEAFARAQGVDFYGAGRGIGHQIMVEEGYAFPNTVTVASDSHSNMYGGVGCLGTPIVRTDACAVWATGKTWFEVPPVVKVDLTGRLRPGVSGKDVIVALCGMFSSDEVLNHAVEFHIEHPDEFPVDYRLTVANMTTEWGALAGVFPVDNVTVQYYRDLARKLAKLYNGKEGGHPRVNEETVSKLESEPLVSDPDCSYSRIITLDLGTVGQYVSGPNSVKLAQPVESLGGVNIQKAYLVSCTNARLSDITAAADVIREEAKRRGVPVGDVKFDPNVSMYISAASSRVEQDAYDNGSWKVLLDAGAIPLLSGCGPCIGLGAGLLKDNENGISSSNRNFKGRMGSRNAQCYLGSPEVVVASALAGHISGTVTGSRDGTSYTAVKGECKDVHEQPTEVVNEPETSSSGKPQKKETGFATKYHGPLVILPRNDISTDSVYSGKATYDDSITFEQQKKYAFENYSAQEFQDLLKDYEQGGRSASEDKILIVGYNFGTGSSREQAVTSLVSAGVKCIIGGSFNSTYKRNAINNGLLCVTCPNLINDIFSSIIKNKLERGNQVDETKLANNEYLVEKGAPLIVSQRNSDDIGVITIDIEKGEIVTKESNLIPGGTKRYHISQVGPAALEILSKSGLEAWVADQLLKNDQTKSQLNI